MGLMLQVEQRIQRQLEQTLHGLELVQTFLLQNEQRLDKLRSAVFEVCLLSCDVVSMSGNFG